MEQVHLQFLGFPIANDPIYNNKRAWGENRAKGGIYRDPAYIQEYIAAKAAAAEAATLEAQADPDYLKKCLTSDKKKILKKCDPLISSSVTAVAMTHPDDLDVLGNGCEVPLTREAAHAIRCLRMVKDVEENNMRGRDMDRPPPPIPITTKNALVSSKVKAKPLATPAPNPGEAPTVKSTAGREPSGTIEMPLAGEEEYVAHDVHGPYCNICGIPLIPDPLPGQLYIWLHAMKYSTDEWAYESKLPEWAREDWTCI